MLVKTPAVSLLYIPCFTQQVCVNRQYTEVNLHSEKNSYLLYIISCCTLSIIHHTSFTHFHHNFNQILYTSIATSTKLRYEGEGKARSPKTAVPPLRLMFTNDGESHQQVCVTSQKDWTRLEKTFWAERLLLHSSVELVSLLRF